MLTYNVDEHNNCDSPMSFTDHINPADALLYLHDNGSCAILLRF